MTIAPSGGTAVVLATYQGERHLSAQLDSIAAQTRLPSVLIVTDDGSTDRTQELVTDFAEHAPFPVRFLAREWPRPERTDRKRAVSENFARGCGAVGDTSLVAFADQDDVWLPDKLARLGAMLEAAPERSFALSDADVIDDTGQPVGRRLSDRWPLPPTWNSMSAEDQLRFALRRPFATGATMVVRAGLVRAALPIPPRWLHDRWFSVVGSALGGSVATSEPLTRYRVHADQTWGLDERTGSGPEALRRSAFKALRLRDVRKRLSYLQVPRSVQQVTRLRSVLLPVSALGQR